MNLSDKIRSIILSHIVPENQRQIGLEIESFYYGAPFNRLPASQTNCYSATDLLLDIQNSSLDDDLFSYSLEPGGQLEWASAPAVSIWNLQKQFNRHLVLEDKICNKHNIKRLHLSLEPFCVPEDIKLIDSKKYKLMHALFTETGDLGPWMMRNTTSIQLNIDYTSEQDANEMAFLADSIQPLFSILFSNAPFMKGEPVGSQNIRWKIWEDTDPVRCRSLFSHGMYTIDQMVADYAKWLQQVPSIFEDTPNEGVRAFEGSLGDMIMSHPDEIESRILSAFHQSFTHVRYKTVLEIRSSDRPSKGNELAPATFMAGLLTSKKIRPQLLEIVSSWSNVDRAQLIDTAHELSYSNIGPQGKTIGVWLETLSSLALEGLDERSSYFNINNERPLLEPLLNDLLMNGPMTLQTQQAYKQSGHSLHHFLMDCCLDSTK